MNKSVWLDLSISDMSKTVMYECWYDYVKHKIWWKCKTLLYGYMYFIDHVKTRDISKYITKDVETRFDTSNFELGRPFPKGKNIHVTGLIKDELSGQIMKEFVGMRFKIYSYLKDNNNEDKKVRGTKKGVIKRNFKFENYKNCLEATQLNNKIKYLEKIKINEDSLKEDEKEFIKKLLN